MNKCKNCAYWETHQYWGEKPFNACDRVDRDDNFRMKIEVSDDTGLTAHLITGPEFGCNYFEVKGVGL